MRLAALLTMTALLGTGCASVVARSGDALCDGTAVLRTDHAAALAQDAGPLSLATGARLIRALDAGCADG